MGNEGDIYSNWMIQTATENENHDLLITLHLHYLSLFNLKGHTSLKQPVLSPN